MPNAKFFNCVDFPVNFRMIWLPGNPAVQLEPGQIIEGPFEKLITYNFLRPIQQQNINPNLSTQDNQGKYLDESVQKDVEEQARLAEKHRETFVNTTPPADTAPSSDQSVVDGWENLQLPFDPMNCNWIKVKATELEEAAKILGITVDENIPPKKKKWELVRLIKAAVGKE